MDTSDRPRPQRAPLRLGDVPDRGRVVPHLRGHAHRQPRARQPLRLRRLRHRVGGGPRPGTATGRASAIYALLPVGALAAAGLGALLEPTLLRPLYRRAEEYQLLDHLRPPADPGRPHAAHLGPLSAPASAALRGPRQPHLRRVDLPDLQPGRDRHRGRSPRSGCGPSSTAPSSAWCCAPPPRTCAWPRRSGSTSTASTSRPSPSAASWRASAAPIIVPQQGAVLGMGVDALILAFVVVVIGGLGSLEGALIGALMVGFVREAGITFFPGDRAGRALPDGGGRAPDPARRAPRPRMSALAGAAGAACCAWSCPLLLVARRPAVRGRAVPDRAALLRPRLRHRRARLQPAAGLHRACSPSATPPTSGWAPTRWPSSSST